MKKKRIIFRADGNVVAGYGHVIRLLSLASILRKKYHCSFIIRDPDTFLKEQIRKVCEDIIELPAFGSYEAEAKKLAETIILKTDIVVLDGYHFSTTYQAAIKKSCFKLVCIDDLHTIHFVADAVINHSEGIKLANYSKEPYTKVYLGTRYAILRKSFLKKQNRTAAIKNKMQSVFINMGGTDQQNYTQKALNICIKNEQIKKIDIVVGSFYPSVEELKKIAAKNKKIKIKIYTNLSEKKIYGLMTKSDIGLCAASTVSYEYASVGGILFVYQAVDNQKNIYSFLIKTQCAYPVIYFDKKLFELKNKKSRTAYFKNRLAYFSGNSAKNLQQLFNELQ